MIYIPTSRHQRYFSIAKESAETSTYRRINRNGTNGRRRVYIGAAIVKGNYVVSVGVNQIKTHPMQMFYNRATHYLAPKPRIHAEMDALIHSRYLDLSGCEIFVYREMVDGNRGECRPCKSCWRALKLAGVKHVYYTSAGGFNYERIV